MLVSLRLIGGQASLFFKPDFKVKQLLLQGLPEFRRFYTKSKLPLFHSRKFSFTKQ